MVGLGVRSGVKSVDRRRVITIAIKRTYCNIGASSYITSSLVLFIMIRLRIVSLQSIRFINHNHNSKLTKV